MPAPTLAALAAPYLAQALAGEPLRLAFGSTLVEVAANDERLLKKLGLYFRDFLAGGAAGGEPAIRVTAVQAAEPELGLAYALKEPEPGKARIKEEYAELADGRVVRKRLTGMHFLFGGGLNLALGPCLENDNQVVNFINNRYIELLVNRGCLLFHASGVALGGAGLAIAGFAGMGKSTLALHIMRRGTEFVSNDRLMVERAGAGLTMHGVAKMPRINPGTVLNNPALDCVIPSEERLRFEELSPDELWKLEHKYDAFIDECYGPGKFRLESRMAGLCLLNWTRDGGETRITRVDPASRRDLLPSFMKSVGLFFESGGPAGAGEPDFSEQAYLDLLGDCPVFELSGGVDFDAAAEVMVAFLQDAAGGK